jgi:D-mannonate dehydratase
MIETLANVDEEIADTFLEEIEPTAEQLKVRIFISCIH